MTQQSGSGRSLWAPSLATVVSLPILLGLGFWQLDRAEEKQSIQLRYRERASKPPIAIGAALLDAKATEFARLRANGRYETAYQLLLDNRTHRGSAGFHVLTPLRIDGSDRHVLVNRGWLAWGNERKMPLKIPTPQGPVRVSGQAKLPPDQPFRLGDPATLVGEGPWLVQHLDLARYAKAVPFPLQPIVIELDPVADAGGFERVWRSYKDEWIVRHHGYALQWFSLAAVLFLFYIGYLWRHRPGGRVQK